MELDKLRQGNQETDKRHKAHDSHKFKRVTVELELKDFRIQNIPYQRALRGQEASASDQAKHLLIADWPRLDNLCPAEKRMSRGLWIRVDFVGHRQACFHDWDWFTREHRFVYNNATR